MMVWGLRKGLRDHKKFMSLKYANRATIHPITTLPRNALVLLYKPRVEKPIRFLTMTTTPPRFWSDLVLGGGVSVTTKVMRC